MTTAIPLMIASSLQPHVLLTKRHQARDLEVRDYEGGRMGLEKNA